MIQLNIKTGYSFFYSALKCKDIISLSMDNKSNYVAINDINNMFGYLELERLAIKNNLTPLYLVEFNVLYLDNKVSFSLLCKSNEGYRRISNLSKLISSYKVKTISYNDLLNYVDGNILIMHSKSINIDLIKKLEEDKIHFYIGLEVFSELNKAQEIRDIAFENTIEVIPFNEVCILKKSDEDVLRALEGIKNGWNINDVSLNNETTKYPLTKEEYDYYYLEEERDLLKRVVDNIKFNIYDTKAPFISYELEQNKYSYFKFLITKGLEKRLRVEVIPKVYLDRLNYELVVINKMGYIDYFLVVWDYVRFAKKNNITVGPGRGSSAGSLISYCLGITNVDPLKYNLFFERFLNPERVTMPDIDIDFLDTRREEVIEYLLEKYGKEKAVHVIAYQTFGIKASLRDVSKVLGLSQYEVDYIAKNINAPIDMSLDELYESDAKFREFIESRKIYRDIFKIARKICGLPRQTTLHAAGMVLANDSLYNYLPLYEHDEGVFATQYDLNYIENVGLLKMDLLGLKNLGIVQNTLENIENNNKKVYLNSINLNDERVLKMFSLGYTTGIFQFESGGMNRTLRLVKPTSFNDLVAINALYRPGPMDQIETFAKRKNGEEEITYLHPSLEPILKDTYGIIVYQEQIMQILQTVASFSLGKADIVRRAISKKDIEKMNLAKDEFLKGCTNNKYSLSIANQIWDLIVKFANYGFNKAHSVAYTMLAYQIAYLKCYYPLEFYTALFNSFDGALVNNEKYLTYVNAMRVQKVNFLNPSINESEMRFIVKGNKILYSLNGIKGISKLTIRNIINERNENGKYLDFIDFVVRSFKFDLSFEETLTLINAGAFDEFKINRSSLRLCLASVREYGQILQGILGRDIIDPPRIRIVEERKEDDLVLENEVLGVFVSSFPLINDAISASKVRYNINKNIKLVGFLRNEKIIKTKKNEEMAFIEIYDPTGSVELTIFCDAFVGIRNKINLKEMFIVEGRVSERNGRVNVLVNSLERLGK